MVRHQQQQEPSRAEMLQSQWRDFRAAGSAMYDALIWSDMKWPALSLAWLPGAAWTQPAAIAAAEAAAQQQRLRDFQRHAAAHLRSKAAAVPDPAAHQQDRSGGPPGAGSPNDMDVDGAAGSSGRQQHPGSSHPQQQQLLQMPVECHYLLTGAQTSGQGTAHVELYRVELPGQLPALQAQAQQRVLMQEGGMQCVMRISHGSLDVNRLAVMPQQPNILATCCDDPEVYLFDLRQHAVGEQQGPDPGSEGMQEASADAVDSGSSSDNEGSSREQDGDSEDEAAGAGSDDESSAAGPSQPPNPQAVLTGRAAGGFGLEFNPVRQGVLLGGDSQGGVQLWDVSSSSGGTSSSNGGAVARIPALQAAEQFAPCAINDLSWHRQGTAYALALESGEVWVQDLRMHASTAAGPSSSSSSSSRGQVSLAAFAGPGAQPPSKARVHVRRRRQQRLQQLEQGGGAGQPVGQDCFCVAFDPLHDHRLASGGADGYVRVMDMRRLDQPVDELPMHAGSVTSVAWSHKLPGLLASAGDDGAVLLWDANKLQHAAAFSSRVRQQGQQGQQQGLGLPEPRQIKTSNLTAEVQQLSLPGLLFMHGGHAGAVGALALNPDRPWLVASATGELVEAADGAGRRVEVQREPVMVWEPNTSQGLLC